MRILTLVFMVLWSAFAWAEQQVPVKITSDTMRYSQNNDEVVFSGSVHVIRLDVELWSNTLTVLLEKQKTARQSTDPLAAQQGSIKKIIAKGDVRIKAENNRSGTCGRATYEAASEILTLEDTPVLREGRNTIQGEVIKLYLRENRSEVIGGKNRVEAIFITPDRKPGVEQ